MFPTFMTEFPPERPIFSTISTFSPRSSAFSVAIEPAKPLPMTMTSYSSSNLTSFSFAAAFAFTPPRARAPAPAKLIFSASRLEIFCMVSPLDKFSINFYFKI